MKNKRNFKNFRGMLDCILSICLIIMIVPVYGIIVYANTSLPIDYEIQVVTPEPIIIEDLVEPVETIAVKTKESLSLNTSYSEPVLLIEEEQEPEYRMIIDEKTYEVLVRVTEAEVTGESFTYKGKKVTEEKLLMSKIRVAQVFMNRVEDQDSFARINDLYESLTEENASSTFKDGRYYKVEITDLTIKAVELALLADTPDYTNGALYFSSGTTTCKYGDYMFTDDVGHSFFK